MSIFKAIGAFLMTCIKAPKKENVSGACQKAGALVKSIYDAVTIWWLHKNTVATKTNTVATEANTTATNMNTAMAAEATEAGTTATGRFSSIIQRAWAILKKPFAYVGSAYAGYLIYTLVFHERLGLTDTIPKIITIGLGIYIGVIIIDAMATGLWVAVGAAIGWCIDKYRSWQNTSRRSGSDIEINIHLHEHKHKYFHVRIR